MSLCVSLAHLSGSCIIDIITTVALTQPSLATMVREVQAGLSALWALDWALDWAQVVLEAHLWLGIVPSLSEAECQNRLLPTSSPVPVV